MKRPVERYQRSPRSYQENVQEVGVSNGQRCAAIKFASMLTEQGQRWFVCERWPANACESRDSMGIAGELRICIFAEIDPARRKSYALVWRERWPPVDPLPVALRSSCASSPDQKSKESKLKKCKGCLGTLVNMSWHFTLQVAALAFCRSRSITSMHGPIRTSISAKTEISRGVPQPT